LSSVPSFAVRKRIGAVNPAPRRRFVTLKPFMSGSMTSRMMRSGSSSSTAEMVAAPLATVFTWNPAKVRPVESRSRMFGSSSTTRMRAAVMTPLW
jgi:hypothetical protein